MIEIFYLRNQVITIKMIYKLITKDNNKYLINLKNVTSIVQKYNKLEIHYVNTVGFLLNVPNKHLFWFDTLSECSKEFENINKEFRKNKK